MSTVDRALSLLDLFSEATPSRGSSDIARELGWDKSTIHRYLGDLCARGLLEQDPADRSFRLGPSLTRLALVRARTHPIAAEVQRALAELVEATGETAHYSTLQGGRLMNQALLETRIRGTLVYIDPAEPLPLHASASGLALLAGLSDAAAKRLLPDTLTAHTQATPTARKAVLAAIAEARAAGHACSIGTFEDDVVGLAVAVRGFDGDAIGAMAVVMPKARFRAEQRAAMADAVARSAERLSVAHGASVV